MSHPRFSFTSLFWYRLEAGVVRFLYKIFGLLPLDVASWLGKHLGQVIGPWHKSSRVARQNIRLIFPQDSEETRQQIFKEMWGHLGRVGMEYPKINAFLDPQEKGRIQIKGREILSQLHQHPGPAILLGAHLGNWQMITLAARLEGVELMQLYRPANNPWFDQLMQEVQAGITGGVITKGPQGARAMVAALQKGRKILALIDQKMNDGISVPFLGYPAMTAPAMARLAQKFQCPLVPVRVERLEGACFQVTFYPPLSLDGTEYDIMKRANDLLSEWIRARPEQWFWVHNRWPVGPEKNHSSQF